MTKAKRIALFNLLLFKMTKSIKILTFISILTLSPPNSPNQSTIVIMAQNQMISVSNNSSSTTTPTAIPLNGHQQQQRYYQQQQTFTTLATPPDKDRNDVYDRESTMLLFRDDPTPYFQPGGSSIFNGHMSFDEYITLSMKSILAVAGFDNDLHRYDSHRDLLRALPPIIASSGNKVPQSKPSLDYNSGEQDYNMDSGPVPTSEYSMQMRQQRQCGLHLNLLINQHRRLTQSFKSYSSSSNLDLIEFFDSYGSPQDSVMRGSYYWLGSYDQCLSAKVSLPVFTTVYKSSMQQHVDLKESAGSVSNNLTNVNNLLPVSTSNPVLVNTNLLSTSVGQFQRQRVNGAGESLNNVNQLVKTRYCIANFRSPNWVNNSLTNDYPGSFSIKIGVCLPETCNSLSIKAYRSLLERLIKSARLSQLPFSEYNMAGLYCLPDEKSELRQLSLSARVFLVFLIFWASLVVYYTIKYEFYLRTKTKKQVLTLQQQEDHNLKDNFDKSSSAVSFHGANNNTAAAAAIKMDQNRQDQDCEPSKLMKIFSLRLSWYKLFDQQQQQKPKQPENQNQSQQSVELESLVDSPKAIINSMIGSSDILTISQANTNLLLLPLDLLQAKANKSSHLVHHLDIDQSYHDYHNIPREESYVNYHKAAKPQSAQYPNILNNQLCHCHSGHNNQDQTSSQNVKMMSLVDHDNHQQHHCLRYHPNHHHNCPSDGHNSSTPSTPPSSISFTSASSATTNRAMNVAQEAVDLSAIDGLKVISMIWLIAAHSLLFFIRNISNGREFWSILKDARFTTIMAGIFPVDTFFTITGILTAYLKFRKDDGKAMGKVRYWLDAFVHRYFRFMPMYLIIYWYTKEVSQYSGSGPLWDYGTANSSLRSVCREESWAVPIFFGANFKPLNEHCVKPAWYLANDFQYLLLTPFLLGIMMKSRFFGYTIMIFMIATSLVLQFVTVFYSQIEDFEVLANFKPMFGTYILSNLWRLYVLPYNRIPPYLIGLLTGHLLYYRGHKRAHSSSKHINQGSTKSERPPKERKTSFSSCSSSTSEHTTGSDRDLNVTKNRSQSQQQKESIKLDHINGRGPWLLSSIIALISIVYLPLATKLVSQHGLSAKIVSSSLIALMRFVWSLAIARLIFVCATRQSTSVVSRFLSSPLWKPWSKVGLPALLIQWEIIIYLAQTQRSLPELSIVYLLGIILISIVITYLLAVPVHLAYENPWSTIERLYIHPIFVDTTPNESPSTSNNYDIKSKTTASANTMAMTSQIQTQNHMLQQASN